MTSYRDRETGQYPLSDFDVRQRFDGGLPVELTQAEFDLLKVDPVFAADPPTYDPATHSVSEGAPELVDGSWRQTWTVTALPPPPPPPPITLSADVLFFERMTDEEYDELDASVRAGETARVYRGWAAATTFTEGTAMWALLDKHLSLVVTVERKAELLARPMEAAFAPVEDPALAA